jgi:hypothetical protein
MAGASLLTYTHSMTYKPKKCAPAVYVLALVPQQLTDASITYWKQRIYKLGHLTHPKTLKSLKNPKVSPK